MSETKLEMLKSASEMVLSLPRMVLKVWVPVGVIIALACLFGLCGTVAELRRFERLEGRARRYMRLMQQRAA